MSRQKSIGLIITVAFASLIGAAIGVKAMSVSSVIVNLAPATVSIDTSDLPPKDAQAEKDAVWRLFDRDTSTAYQPMTAVRATVSLPAAATVSRLRIFGASSYVLNVYRSTGDAWEAVPSLTGVDLTNLGPAWNSVVATDAFTASLLRLEFVPQGNITAGLREMEIRGPEPAAGKESPSYISLGGVGSPQDLSTLLKESPQQIRELSAFPAELAIVEGATAEATIELAQKPALFRRAYLLYDGHNLVRLVSIERRINGLSWAGGFALPRPQDQKPSWSTYLEEINPRWLTQGNNRIEFRTSSGQASIRNIRLVIETDSGWNAVSSVDAASAYDGNTATAYTVAASSADPAVEIRFDRVVQPETIRLHVPGPANLAANLQYLNGNSWQDVKTGWNIDLSALQSGWNDLTVPAPVATQALRLVFNTSGLPIKPGVRVAALNELRVSSSPVGALSSSPRIVVSYPRDGGYFGRTAYLQGFATPATDQSGNAGWVNAEGKDGQRTVPDGSFSISLSKDDTRFYDQADNDDWQPVLQAVYGGSIKASQSVLLNKNAGSTSGDGPVKESRGNAAFPDARNHHTEKVSPGQAKKIQYEGVILDIPEGAVDMETDITIVPLTEADLAHYDPGMINVTSPAAGYRFLPHGIKFKKAINVSFGYSKQLLAAGQTDNDVSMFYYDESLLRWQPLARVKVDPAAAQVTSSSDHFTDIINSTLVTPEHAQALSFNPNSIKDIKAAEPAANVNLIEPPQANNKGTANLSYPIEVPPGRNKLQPNLAVQYNSAGGNGWMGLGWDIPMQAITIDTRWGAARYNAASESDTYMLDGEQLAPLAHRGQPVPRTAEKVFHTRVEGQFRKIVRHGSNPNNYWWEVTDKNGTRYFYGGDAVSNGPAADSTLVDGNGNVFLWALREVRDTNNNFIRYHCKRVNDSVTGRAAGVNLYLKKITYTGTGTAEGPYSVAFVRDRELGEQLRVDKQIDGRGGFKRTTGDLLRRVDVSFGAQLIRSYEFKYDGKPYGDDRPGTAFRKTLLSSLTQYGAKGTVFNKHEFTYYDEARNANGSYRGFHSESWSMPGDGISAGLMGYGDASALGGTTSDSFGGHLYIGIGSAGNTSSKNLTGGFKVGYSQSDGESLIAMADMDGDGLPDKVFKNGGYYYRKNLSGPHGSHAFGGAIPINLPGISHENVTSTTWGGEIFIYVPLQYDHNEAETENDVYFSDVNGDGLTDVVSRGTVWFNHLENGVPTFTLDSSDTPAPIGVGTVDTNGLLPDRTTQEAEREDKFPLLDAVRRWVAPFDGTVSIDAPVRLIQDTSDARARYQRADGLRVAIQLEGGELWSTVIGPDDYGRHDPTNVGSVPVHRGDRLYFRVQSVYNGLYDQVAWDPVITYLDRDPNLSDVNGMAEYVYQASRDFTLAGRESNVTVPVAGTLHLAGTLQKKGVTTDDVKLSITKNGTEVYSHTFGYAEQNATFNLDKDLQVAAQDTLEWHIRIDSPIDVTQVSFTPKAYYTAADGIDSVIDENGNYVLKIDPPYQVDLYPVTDLTAPQEFFVTSQSGTLTVRPVLDVKSSVTTPTEAVFTAKRKDTLLGKAVLSITRDDEGNLIVSSPTLIFPVKQGEQFYFDFSTRDTDLANHIDSHGVKVTYNTTTPPEELDAPDALRSAMLDNAFPEPFRGWGVVGYNGNSPRDTAPIDQSLLVLDDNFDAENARVYPFSPQPDKDRWGGVDDGAWIKAGETSSSRIGLKDIRMRRSEDFAGAAAPSRMSESENDAVSVASVGGSKGNSKSQVDFQDMNGDGFPDVIGNAGVQYTAATGELGAGTTGGLGLGAARSSSNEGYNVSTDAAGNIAVAIANGKGSVAPSAQGSAPTGQQSNDMPRLGLSANGGHGTSETDYDLIDINGDGLPDKVSQGGNVLLNLGYKFVGDGGGTGNVNSGSTDNGGVSLSFNSDWYSLAGGLNVGLDKTTSSDTYVDINGDGLQDKMSGSSVQLNTGSNYVPLAWPGARGDTAKDKHVSMGGGVYFTVGFNVYIVRIVINIGVNYSNNIGRPEIAFRDVDGDGYVDQLHSENDGQLQVARNQIGRTNLLKTVTRPLGGKIALEYQREGNTYEMPQSQWILTKTTLTDGRGNSYATAIRYADGYKDRYEREFYGFKTVTETQAQGTPIERTVTQTFNNRDYYLKGLLLKSATTDINGSGWARTDNTYTLFPVDGYDFTEFPALTKTDTYFYDGSGAGEDGYKKSTYQTFGYDSKGNVIAFFDAGEVFTADDDVSAAITYYTDSGSYIMKPAEIKVFGPGNSTPLRWRTASYAPGTGNLLQIILHNTGTTNSVWNMVYDIYGNIQTITDPVGYVLSYGYDQETATYVSSITDNFSGGDGGPYYSTASYNLLFGTVRASVDLNGNVEARGYDEFGRLGCVYGPYDASSGDPDSCSGSPTIAFAYVPPAIIADTGDLIAPAGAITFNRAVSSKGSSPIVIKTATYGDGMNRIIETKKDADVNGSYGMTVSGLVVFDALGRVAVQGQPVFTQGYSPSFVQLTAAKNPTFFSYDTLDRTTTVQTPDAAASGGYATTTTTYGFGQVKNSGILYATTVVVDPEGNKVGGANRRGTKVSYKDVHNRIMAVMEFNNGLPITTQYAYDPLGQIRSVVDEKGNTTVVDYDQVGNRTLIDNPDTGATRYGYDANGNLASKQNANSQKIIYHYVFNRLTDVAYPRTPTVHYDYGAMREAYNRAGRIKKVTDESGTEERFYGRLGETTREVRTVQAHTPAVRSKTFTTDYVFDSFGRMWEMTYPDGEVLRYSYDNGGLLKAAWGEKSGNRYDYITSLLYDEFGQRTHIEYGNKTKTDYAYDQLTRRLAALTTKLPDGRDIQNVSYRYDLVGNVMDLGNTIAVATNTALPAGPVSQSFGYDDLYQLTAAQGQYAFGPGKQNTYSNTFGYDTIGNMTRKVQVNQIIQPSSTTTLPKRTNYVLNYTYGSLQPHAVTDDGTKIYSYDRAGNMTGWKSKTSGKRRTIIWSEENRVKEIDDNGRATTFLYDDAGERVVKRGQHGETIYVNRFYSVKNGELGSKHIYAGETRVLSKLVKTPNTVTSNSGTVPGSNGLDHGIGKKRGIIRRLADGTTTGVTPPVEKDEFYYHGDHLGSSNMITDSYGQVYQHLEYFPYGESWIEEGGSHGGNLPGYKFTGKELDSETGLYYYGARYYDPVLSKWISADPILGKYLPTINRKSKAGLGGIFNPRNLALYTYSQSNPIILRDPDGKEAYVGSRDLAGPSPIGVHSFNIIVTDDPSKYGNYAARFSEYTNTTGNFPGVEKGKTFYAAILGAEKQNGKLAAYDFKGNSGDQKAMTEVLEGAKWYKADADLTLQQLTPTQGLNQLQMEMNMFAEFDNYNNTADYGAFAIGSDYNCHTFTTTLSSRSGVGNFPTDLPGVDPGTGKKLPGSFFGDPASPASTGGGTATQPAVNSSPTP